MVRCTPPRGHVVPLTTHQWESKPRQGCRQWDGISAPANHQLSVKLLPLGSVHFGSLPMFQKRPREIGATQRVK